MKLVLVRHAETEASARGRCYGSLDVGLSPTGRRQCEVLAGMLAPEPVEAVVSSDRQRAIETATAIAMPHGLDVRRDPDLRELDFGELEGRSYDEIAISLPQLYADWMTRPTEVTFPGGECYAELRSRSLAVVESLLETCRGRTVVVVTHGGVVRAILADVLDIPDERIFRLAVDPGSVSVIEWNDAEPIVRGLHRLPAGG